MSFPAINQIYILETVFIKKDLSLANPWVLRLDILFLKLWNVGLEVALEII